MVKRFYRPAPTRSIVRTVDACFAYRNHQDWARRTVENLLGHAAQQDSPKARTSVAAHDDQIGSNLGSVIDDFVARIAFDALGLTLDSGLSNGSREHTQTFV